MFNSNKSLLRRLESLKQHHIFKKKCVMKPLIYATAFSGVLGMALAFSPAVVADSDKSIHSRVVKLEAKDKIRTTLHAFVSALNSTFISGATDPLKPIEAALHADIVLSATPPPTPSPIPPEPVVYNGRDDVIELYGQGVVVSTRPNILVSAMNVQLTTESTAVAELRFANSVNFPPGCMLGTLGCAQVMLFADVYATLQQNHEKTWQVTTVNLLHYVAHSGPFPMTP